MGESDIKEAKEDRETSFTRRALIQAGWTVPVIMAVAPPQAFAQSPGGHNDGHNDHGDAPHGDTHLDIPG